MVPAPAVRRETLAELLHDRAITTPVARLAIEFNAGAAITLAAQLLPPTARVLLGCAGVCVAMSALWAVAETHIAQPDASPRPRRVASAWRALRTLSALVGVAAAITVILVSIAASLGTWVS